MRLCKLIVIVSALVLTFPVFSKLPAGQSPQNPPKSAVPTLKVYARETIVDVIVTDSKGEPIRGLKQSDFLIKEDGKPQPVRSFKEYGFEPPLPGGLIRKPPPPNIHSNVDVVPTSGPVNIILIDALHLDIVSTVRSLQAIAQYFKRMPQGTEVAIFWLSSSGLHLLQGFTSDPTLLLAAAQTNRTDIGSNEDCYEQDWATADALNQIAVYVAGIQGRKNLVWFTPGMPLNLMRDGGYSWGAASSCRDATPRAFGGNFGDSGGLVNVSCGTLDRFGGQCNSGPTLFTGSEDGIDMGMVHRLMDLYELFSEEQIAISPVSSLGVGGLGTAQLVAEQVAEQSGGIAQYNSNDLSARLAQAIDQGSHFYTLSYIPPRRNDDGHYHTIAVTLDRPSAHLVYRTGYNAEDPKQPKQFSGPELIKAALAGKTPPAAQLLFDAKIQPVAQSPDSDVPNPFAAPFAPTPASPPAPAKKGGGKTSAQRIPYDLLLAVPQSQITFAEGPGGTHIVSLEFAFDTYDNYSGKLLGGHSQNVSLTLTPDRYQEFIQSPVFFHEQISFYPGPLFLRVGILDSNSNKVGTLEIPLTIPKK